MHFRCSPVSYFLPLKAQINSFEKDRINSCFSSFGFKFISFRCSPGKYFLQLNHNTDKTLTFYLGGEVNVELFSNIINFVNRQLSSEETIYSQNVFPKIRQPAAIAPFHSILTTKSLRKSFAQVIAFETADWSRPVVRIRGIFRLFVQLICANSQCHQRTDIG